MIKIITFLGERGALSTDYHYQGNIYEGGVFAEALHQFCEYDEMLVCVTDVAKTNTYPVLEKLQDSRIKAIDIPTGRTTAERWQTFQIITAQVDEGDQVIFDITHGLRSLPFLVFLFAAYLKSAKNVKLNAIYYGALELKESRESPAPIIDLSEFVGMLDWIAATEQFVKSGEGLALADLLKNAIPPSTELRDNPASRLIRDQLKDSVEAITDISLSLSLTRPLETLNSTVALEEILNQADLSFEQRAKPFSLLSSKIIHEYGQFSLKDGMAENNLAKNLQLQFQMIQWYIDRGQIVQSMTLAREWLVSVVAYRLGVTALLDKDERQQTEYALNNGVAKLQNKEPRSEFKFDASFSSLHESNQLCRLWSKLTDIRNDIAHCGMNINPDSASSLKKRAIAIIPVLQEAGQASL